MTQVCQCLNVFSSHSNKKWVVRLITRCVRRHWRSNHWSSLASRHQLLSNKARGSAAPKAKPLDTLSIVRLELPLSGSGGTTWVFFFLFDPSEDTTITDDIQI